ncbi:ATP-binding cassette domain-containing protein [Lentzea indica]|uniref:ATP-binding cassette domain-containing protein n=1 Tax=Lentzea indica TaxID=2604800 RepID=UPI0028AF3D63|nr:ATP-binding cassette domain-containing protein [Lentzea indica]
MLVGGVDLREIDRTKWLEALAWVPQRPTLVPAALSSGEQQRVALAKALDRQHAGLFLLDEPTAHLDAETESLVLRATREFTRGRTAVIVAHRPALLNEVNRVVTV